MTPRPPTLGDALPTSDPEPEVQDLPGGRLAYVDEGPRDAPALIAVHGIPGSVRDFRYLAPQVTACVRFIRVDLPGFGGSDVVEDAVRSLPGRARTVVALADRLGLREFGVLGHSMGGGTALVAAALEPGRVRRLALVCSLGLSLHRGLGAPPALFGLAARATATPVLGHVLLPFLRAAYRRRRFPGVEDMGRGHFARQLRAFAATDFGLMRRAAAGPLPPILLAYARDDHMVETRVSEELAAALPAARVLAFDDGGHNIQKTRAVEVGRALREWMAGGPPR
jgi:pimeloyl-ACP methyl ester carboxylesterase